MKYQKQPIFTIVVYFDVSYYISAPVTVSPNRCNDYPLILNVSKLIVIMKLYYLHA